MEIFHICFDKQIKYEIYKNSTTGEKQLLYHKESGQGLKLDSIQFVSQLNIIYKANVKSFQIF